MTIMVRVIMFYCNNKSKRFQKITTCMVIFHSCTPLHQQHQFNTSNKQINMNENFVKVK